MTVKVIDAKLYDWYLTELGNLTINEVQSMVNFVHRVYENFSDEEIAENADIGHIANALFTGEDVELHEPKYRVLLPHITGDDEQFYLTLYNNDEWNIWTDGSTAKQVFTMDEIPEEYRQWAERVK